MSSLFAGVVCALPPHSPSPAAQSVMARPMAGGEQAGRNVGAENAPSVSRASTRLSGSWRPTSGSPPVRRPAHARDGLPGVANHYRKGGVMSSTTHVEREQTLDVAVDPRLSRGV